MDKADQPKSSAYDVRKFGALIAVAGVPAAYRLADWPFHLQWIGFFDIAVGLSMVVWPHPLRRRAAIAAEYWRKILGWGGK